MHVQFKVHGSGKKNLHGDGIAIWYTRDRLQAGSVTVTARLFQSFGRRRGNVLSKNGQVLFDEGGTVGVEEPGLQGS